MRRRDRTTELAIVSALAIAILAVGGAVPWSVVALVIAAGVGCGFLIPARRQFDGVSPLLVLVAVAFVLTALQLIPLPDAVFASLQPTGRELIADGARLLDEPVKTWRPLSLDPASTRFELAKLTAYLLIAWMAVRFAANERGRRRLLTAVGAAVGGVAVIAIVHELLGASRLYGFYAPAHANPIVMAPLLNGNHLASLMALGAIICVGLALNELRAPPVRALWIITALLCIGVLLATRSRGGVMGLAAGATVMAVLVVLQRLRSAQRAARKDVHRVVLPAAIVVLCTLVLVVYFGGSEVRNDLEATRLAELDDPRSKYAAWRSAVQLIDESPVFGIGRGAFESAFTRVHPASSSTTFSHLENQYLQIVVDWGVLGALAIALALVLLLHRVLQRWRTGVLAAAAIAALAAVAVQSLVDFGLELPGIAVPTLLVAATLLYVPLKESSPTRRPLFARAALVAGTMMIGAIASTSWARPLRVDHDELRRHSSMATARAALSRHPLDYIAATYVAREATDPKQRIAFLNHALRLHPSHPGLHRTAARLLVATGRRGQAALEYRLALEGTLAPEGLVAEVVTRLTSVDDAAAALPTSHRRWRQIVAALLDARREDVAVRYLTSLGEAEERSSRIEVWRRLRAIAEKTNDLAAAERAAQGILRLEGSPEAAIALAEVQIARKRYVEAEATLTPLLQRSASSVEHVDATILTCQVLMSREDMPAARSCLTRALSLPVLTLDLRRKIHSRLAKVEDALGNPARANLERRLAGEQSQ